MPCLDVNGELAVAVDSINKVEKFTETFGELFSDGWVVKTPFTTSGSPYRSRYMYCKTMDHVWQRILKIARLSNAIDDTHKMIPVIKIPYIMLQPRVNNDEMKILVINGKAKYPCSLNAKRQFKTELPVIYEFVEKVVKDLHSKYPELMVEYILRVDLFEIYDKVTQSWKLKVNEFESFDADFLTETEILPSRKHDKDWNNAKTNDFIRQFWYNTTDVLINKALQ